MTQDEYTKEKASGRLKQDAQPEAEARIVNHENGYKFEDFLPALFPLRAPIRHLTDAPTFVPKTYLDSFQLFDDGVDRRLYIYFNGAWSFSTLT
jgi:hypothetical protein